jgi:hypothetical protein
MKMNSRKIFESIEIQNQVITRLARLKMLRKYGAGKDQAGTLVHALSDLEESFVVVLEKLLPKLKQTSASDRDLEETLLDLGDEVRHIFYHLTDVRFFRPYLIGSPDYKEDTD